MRLIALATLLFLTACATDGGHRAADPAPAAPAAPATASQPAVLENVIRWSTASEVDNFGYDVFRGPTEEGPFERVNETPIPGHGTTDEPRQYAFHDTSIAPDTVYYYYVESISLQGERERFTPVFASRPKPAPAR